jgi:hypothetical protein
MKKIIRKSKINSRGRIKRDTKKKKWILEPLSYEKELMSGEAIESKVVTCCGPGCCQ